MYHFPKSFTEYIFVVINHNNLSIFTLLKCIIIKCNGVLECVILWVSFNSYSTYVLKALLLIIMYNNNKKKLNFGTHFAYIFVELACFIRYSFFFFFFFFILIKGEWSMLTQQRCTRDKRQNQISISLMDEIKFRDVFRVILLSIFFTNSPLNL
jgi:hypothetical protein